MRFSDYLINEGDVVNLAARRTQKATQNRQAIDAEQDRIIDEMDHAIARAIDAMTKVVGNEMEAHEIISNHLGVMYDYDVQY